MLIHHKKNTSFELAIPAIDSTDSQLYKSGLTVTDVAYYHDGGSWTLLTLVDAFSEIGATGMYEISLTAAEMNHDWVIIQIGVAGMDAIFASFRMFTDDIDSVGTDTAAILVDTAVIGALGAGLTDLGGMSTGMKAEVNAECDTALADYDAPTKAEMDSGFSALNDPTAATIADSVWDEATAGHVSSSTFGEQCGTDIDDLLVDTAAIVSDTSVIGIAGAGLTDLGGMSTGMKAEVNAELVDVLSTDTQAELLQGAPPKEPTLKQMLHYLYQNAMFRFDQTATTLSLYNDLETVVIAKMLVSDDGTTFIKGRAATGP